MELGYRRVRRKIKNFLGEKDSVEVRTVFSDRIDTIYKEERRFYPIQVSWRERGKLEGVILKPRIKAVGYTGFWPFQKIRYVYDGERMLKECRELLE